MIRMLKKLLMEERSYIDQAGQISLHAADQKKRIEIIPMGQMI